MEGQRQMDGDSWAKSSRELVFPGRWAPSILIKLTSAQENIARPLPSQSSRGEYPGAHIHYYEESRLGGDDLTHSYLFSNFYQHNIEFVMYLENPGHKRTFALKSLFAPVGSLKVPSLEGDRRRRIDRWTRDSSSLSPWPHLKAKRRMQTVRKAKTSASKAPICESQRKRARKSGRLINNWDLESRRRQTQEWIFSVKRFNIKHTSEKAQTIL